MLEVITYTKSCQQRVPQTSLSLILTTSIKRQLETYSNNSSAITEKLLNVFDHFVGLALKGLEKALLTKNSDKLLIFIGHD